MNFSNWFKSLVNPVEVFREEKKNADLVEAVKIVGITGFILSIFYAISYVISTFLFADMMTNMGMADAYWGESGSMGMVLLVGILIVILCFIFNILFFLIQSGLLFIFAKLFGGKGDFSTQTYLISLPYAALTLIEIPFVIFNIIPFIGFLFSLVSLLIWIYGLYPLTIALKETHDYDTMKAVLTWVVLILIIVVIPTILIVGIVLWQLGVFNI